MPTSGNDEQYMLVALRLARRNLGNTSPNPSVGCVLVKDDVMIGKGWTGKGGRPHAETQALDKAGKNAKGATAYITLEPCCHQGKTPPCTNALIKAGIKRAVIATTDPHEKMNGKGVSALKDAGIEVTEGVLEGEANLLNKGFILTITENRPLVTLKLATTKNGRIKTKSGKWFTCEEAKNYAHLLRYRNDAIMVGTETVLQDNPELTCRLPGLEEFSPLRVVPDISGKIPSDAKIFNDDNHLILKDKAGDRGINIKQTLSDLAERGITRLLVEGGGKLAESFLNEDVVDILIHIQSPSEEGDESAPDMRPIITDYSHKTTMKEERTLGTDSVTIYSK